MKLRVEMVFTSDAANELEAVRSYFRQLGVDMNKALKGKATVDVNINQEEN